MGFTAVFERRKVIFLNVVCPRALNSSFYLKISFQLNAIVTLRIVMLIFMKVEMEAADETSAAVAATNAAAGQMESQEQFEEEEVKTNTKQFCISAITDHWTRFSQEGMIVTSTPLE